MNDPCLRRYWLVLMGDRHFGQRVSLGPGESMLIGRDEAADVRLDDAIASRRHCRFLHRAAGLVVEDLDSKNGTTVNGRPVEGQRPLRVGDTVRAGSAVVRVAAVTRADETAGDAIAWALQELEEARVCGGCRVRGGAVIRCPEHAA